MRITGKAALITGASGGVGRAIAEETIRAGAAEVLLLARNETKLAEVAAEIEALGGKARCYLVDLSNEQAVEQVAERIRAEAGVPGIIINNAGVGRWRHLWEEDAGEIERLMALPYFAAAWLTRLFLPAMPKRGTGHIVNISSVASRMAWPGATAYIAAARALRGLSDALRADLHGTRVGVTHCESGPIDTPYWQNNPGSRERVPGIARWLVPELSAQAVACAAVNGVRRNRQNLVTPFMLRNVYRLHAVFPWLVQWLMITTGYRSPSASGDHHATAR